MTDPTTGVLLFVAYRAMEERILAAVHAAGFTDVTLAQARVLARIGPEGTRLTDLAAQARRRPFVSCPPLKVHEAG